jgi:hypothetical protein
VSDYFVSLTKLSEYEKQLGVRLASQLEKFLLSDGLAGRQIPIPMRSASQLQMGIFITSFFPECVIALHSRLESFDRN